MDRFHNRKRLQSQASVKPPFDERSEKRLALRSRTLYGIPCLTVCELKGISFLVGSPR